MIRQLSSTLQGGIYEAQDTKANKHVAIKVASKSRIAQARQNGILENITTEIAVMRKVHSEHVIRLIDSFEDAYCVYAVMELAENGDLFNRISNLHSFDEHHAKTYFRELAQAVKDLHDRNVCHLDLSLENVLISKSGALKVCDFGVARFASSELISTHNGQFRPGKLMYMSPECSTLNRFDGMKADVYSLGILLFCMLYQFNPYTSQATQRFRKFQCSNEHRSNQDEILVEEYMDHLQKQPAEQVELDDLAYGSILCNDADLLFELYGLRGEASSLAEHLISSMLCLERDRVSIEAILEHPWLQTVRS
jgi:serine/threonine protein kinase